MSTTAAPPPPIEAPRHRRLGLRLALGCLVVLIASAGTTVVFGLEQVRSLTEALSQNPSLNLRPGQLAPAGFGDPQTLLLVGNDQRKHTTTQPVLPHSNEMLLVRFDPNKPWISMMSIPRELWVTIYPPNAPAITTRFNYAYTAGGIPLLVSTIKRVLGLSVNHVVVIDFNQFKRAVDEMGCVYSTVDRRYFHVNTPTSEQYQEINLHPGYQNLCGTQALEFVSYRHGDTSLVRDARDQSFLLSVKQQYGPTLVDNIHKFEQIFGRTVQTDPGLHTTDGILNLLGTLISSAGLPVRRVQFQVNLLPTYDTASQQQITQSVDSFLYGGSALRERAAAALARSVRRRRVKSRLPLVATPPAQLTSARSAAARLPFVLEYPRVQDSGAPSQPTELRSYLIHAPGGAAYPIYVGVFSNGLLGQFYDVQGTTWATAPLLDSPTQTIHLGARTYDLYYEGQHLETVAWHEHGAVYWVHNTLLGSLSNGEMLALAEQTTPVSGVNSAGSPHVRLTIAKGPSPTVASSGVGLMQTLGSLAGLLTLIAAPLLVLTLLRRRRELTGLRLRLQTTAARATALHGALAGMPAALFPAPVPAPGPFLPITVHATPRRIRLRVAIIAAAVAVTLAAGGGVALLTVGSSTTHRASAGAGRSSATERLARAAAVTVPVAVLNATSAQGAASQLAHQLRAEHVRIETVGNIVEPGSSGLLILYGPGDHGQALRLAHLLRSRRPTVAPIDPTAQAAAGPGTKLAVVIG